MELGKKLRALRLNAELTQEQVASRVGVAPQSVSKWELGTAMPDIASLPTIAGVFGVTIDDLFDLTVEQRFARIESRIDVEENLLPELFLEYEEFLTEQLKDERYKKKALELLGYLYWNRYEAIGKKASAFAEQMTEQYPDEKINQWILSKTKRHAIWDWNLDNHADAIDFYRQIVEKNPQKALPLTYLLDNLIADRRCNEAEFYLEKLEKLKDQTRMPIEVYQAHIALARFDEQEADRIMKELYSKNSNDTAVLFETAQYYARKGDYGNTIHFYEECFQNETRRPRFTDELMSILTIYKIQGDYAKAAETADRIIALLKDEWGMKEESELKVWEKEKARCLELASKKHG